MAVATNGTKQSQAILRVPTRLAAIFLSFENCLILILVKHMSISLSQIHLPKSFKL
jgi:hypothetical protein